MKTLLELSLLQEQIILNIIIGASIAIGVYALVLLFRKPKEEGGKYSLPKFKIKEGKEGDWEEGLAKNQDSYGACTYRFSAKWAHYMEREMAKGKKVEDIAEDCCSEADKDEGISGFMYGCAVEILSNAWEHGEELRKWHNIDTQIGNEGEKANESGGVLNPAVMSIGTEE